ncbi:acyloxyacyl hydrolase [Rhodobacteraceae bacterium XHP0102]|nr:acyloxyacyl hydrolase [Rhodobacteraceae bacterium XHP0102]
MRVTLAGFLCASILCASGAAYADRSVIGGVRDSNNDGNGLVVEYHWTGGLRDTGAFTAGWAASALTDSNDNGFVGFGVSGEYGFGGRGFVEASFMPGYYSEGDVDLGGSLHFRSTLGIGAHITDRTALSLAVTHISNAGLKDRNPGMDLVMLRLSRRY